MKGLILLSLMGFILAMSSRATETKQGQKPMDSGVRIPMENEGGFNSTTNSTTNVTTSTTTAPKKRLEWKGTWKPIENAVGFGPPPENEENTQ